jgi:hypothetical protein
LSENDSLRKSVTVAAAMEIRSTKSILTPTIEKRKRAPADQSVNGGGKGGENRGSEGNGAGADAGPGAGADGTGADPGRRVARALCESPDLALKGCELEFVGERAKSLGIEWHDFDRLVTERLQKKRESEAILG